MKISAVVCTYNREAYLPKCLESIANQDIDKELFEIVLINNNSTDSTEEICNAFIRKYPDIEFHYFIEENQGLSHARNRGIMEANAELITFIDDDAFLDKQYLSITVGFFKANPDVLAVGGKIIPYYETSKPSWMSKYLAPLVGYFDMGNIVVPFKKKSYPRGSNMSFHKRAFNDHGLFNTELGRKGNNLEGGEEKDLFMRLYSANQKVYYVPDAVVFHAVPAWRLNVDFIKKQAIGTGISEKNRVKNNRKKYFDRLLQELFKWVATSLLFLFYLFSLRPPKAFMLIRFRYWVSKGFLSQ